MEIKIKDKDQLIDATIEVVDGVMIVSPKEEKYEPKDGDVVFSGSSLISIFKEMTSDTSITSYVALSNGELENEFDFWSASNIRPATEEEKQKLFDKIDAEGYEWNPDERKLVRKKWKPIEYEMFYSPILNTITFGVYADGWSGCNSELELLNKGWVFRTEEECEEFCRRLNQAIEGVKP